VLSGDVGHRCRELLHEISRSQKQHPLAIRSSPQVASNFANGPPVSTLKDYLIEGYSPSSTRPRVTSPIMVVRLITRRTPGGVPVAQCMMRQLSQRIMSPSCHW